MKKLFLLFVTLTLLTGCATFGDTFSNDVTCSIGDTKAFVISSYGAIGISSEIKKSTSLVLCAKKEPPAPAAK